MEKLLNEIAEIKAGQGAPQGSENYSLEGTPFIKAGNLYDLIHGQSINSIQKVNDNVAKEYRLKKFPAGTVVFAKSGMSCLKGYVYVLPTEAFVVNHLACIVPYSDLSEYLKYYFVQHKPSELIKDNSYPSIRLSDISEIKINIPDLSVCNRVVTILNNIEALLYKKKIQLLEYDQLIKSRFAEMFEILDLNQNQSGWIKLGDISHIVTGTTPSTHIESYWGGSHLWITPAELGDDTFYIYNTERKLTNEGIKSKSLSVMPINTVLLSTRAPIGKTGIIGNPMSCNQGFKNFICSPELDPIYLYALLRFNTEYLNSLGSGSTFKELSKNAVSKIKIPLPNIKLQKKFAEMFNHVQQLKMSLKKSILETEMLFGSLMQEYFG